MSAGLENKNKPSSSAKQGTPSIDEDVKKWGFEVAFIKSLKEGNGNAKELVEKYSKIFLGVSAVLSTINYTACYALVASGGADIVAFLSNLGIKDVDPKTATIGGNLAIAYVFYKVSQCRNSLHVFMLSLQQALKQPINMNSYSCETRHSASSLFQNALPCEKSGSGWPHATHASFLRKCA
jgi:hypothetical protein